MTNNSNLLSFLGLMKKAGRLAVGDEPSYDAVRAGRARLIIVASDASQNTVRRAQNYAQKTMDGYALLPVTKQELGNALGRASCAFAAVCDAKFSKALMQKLPPDSVFQSSKKQGNIKFFQGEREEI